MILRHYNLQAQRETSVGHDLRHIDTLLGEGYAEVRVELRGNLDDDLARQGVAIPHLDCENIVVVLTRLIDAIEVSNRGRHTEDPIVWEGDSWVAAKTPLVGKGG